MKRSNNTLYKAFTLFEKYSWVLGVLILVTITGIYTKDKIDFHLNHSETYGEIYDISYLRVVRFGKLMYKYKFSINGEEYAGTSTKTFNGENIMGRIFKVKYLPENPKENEIFFNQEYERKFYIDKNGSRKTIFTKKKEAQQGP